MSSQQSPKTPAQAAADAAPTTPYEPPRILSKRSVERVTLLSQQVPGPGGGIGGH
jgi:hypothetical protein